MIIYVDESYPDSQEQIIIGALFVGTGSHAKLTSRVHEIKKNCGFVGEIKYSKIIDKTRYQVARRMVEAYFSDDNSAFNACIIPYSATKLEKFTGVDTNQKRVNIYTDSAKKLILGNLPKDTVSQVYFDEEERIKKTKLFSRLLKAKSTDGGRISSAVPMNSGDESRCLLQICDLLTGAIKQNLYPSASSSSKYKRRFSKLVLSLAGVQGCDISNWKRGKKRKNHKRHPKFYISYFIIPTSKFDNVKEP